MPWTQVPEYENEIFDTGRHISYSDAIREGLSQALSIDSSVFILGEGVDEENGIFGTTRGLAKKYGKERVIDMPLAENAMAGFTIGASHVGMRPVCVHMRSDFLLLAIDQIANHAAKWRYMFGGQVETPVVFRSIIGRGWGSGAQHAQALYPLFMHFPGLRVVAPSNPLDAKGMILGAIKSNDPVIIFEHRWLYNLEDNVPELSGVTNLEKAAVVKEGEDVTIVTSGLACKVALDTVEVLSASGITPEVIDLRSLKPLDIETIGKSVKKTGHLIVFDFCWETCGVGSEVISQISQHFFPSLKKAPINLAFPECSIPAAPVLEKEFYLSEKDLVDAAVKLLS